MVIAALELLVAFLVAPLPAAWKKRLEDGRYDAAPAQIASGVAQFALAAALHFIGIIRATGAYFEGPGMAMINKLADRTDSPDAKVNLTAFGFIGGAGYMFSPAGLLLLYLAGEGLVRAIDPAVTGDRPGSALLALPAWGLRKLAASAAAKRERDLLGPDRDDEWETPAAPGGALWFYSVRVLELSPVQCVAWRGEFFVLDAPGALAVRGAGHAYAFRFRPLRPGEILRCAPWVVPERED